MVRSSPSLQKALLLKTRLCVPPIRPSLVQRPRLTDRLNTGLDQRLVLVSAPAGFGKTTLLSEWISRGNVRAAWVSLDEDDNDVTCFLAYVVAALQTIEPEIGEAALAMLQAPKAPEVTSALTHLVNEIAGIPDHFVLILDDYHMIKAQPVHDALTFFLDHSPPQMHLVISTRTDPPLPIARLRGRGELIELRQTDLRFTCDEAAEFLNRAMKLGLSTEDVAALTSRTEGWIAGLQMAAVSMQGRRDIPEFIAALTGSQHHILDYLVEEVLERQPEHVQSFLLQTCILDRMSGSLCDEVIGSPLLVIGSSQAMLDHLEHANLFVFPLDDHQQWYRYHHLFADLLRNRLQQTNPDHVPVLHRRASAWYEQKGFVAEAIDHALSADDFERAANLVSKQAESLWAHGEYITLSRWLGTLPDALVSSWPELTIHHAVVLFMAGRLDEVEQHLQMAERVFWSSPDHSSSRSDEKLQGMIAMVRAYLALFRGDARGMAQFSRQALEYLPEENSMWRSGAAMILGDAYSWSGDIASAIRNYTEAMAISQAIGNVYYALMAVAKLATTEAQGGHLRRAAEVCRGGLQLAQESGLAKTSRAGVLIALLGRILSEWNDPDTALEYAQTGVTLCEQDRNVITLGYTYAALATVLAARNDIQGIEDAFQKLEKLAREVQVPNWIMASAAAWKAYSLIKQNKLEAAARFLQERGLSLDGELALMHVYEYLMLARLFVAQGRVSEATPLLERLAQTSEAHGRIGWLIGILAVQALAYQAQGDTAQAMESLTRALVLAEPEGYVRVFIGEGEPMAQLLRHALSRGTATEYVAKLLAALEKEKKDERRTQEQGASSAVLRLSSDMVETLSERELEVLRLLNTDLSSAEIAQELVVSANTIRSHIKSIYGKLNAHSRYEAVARAKELGLP